MRENARWNAPICSAFVGIPVFLAWSACAAFADTGHGSPRIDIASLPPWAKTEARTDKRALVIGPRSYSFARPLPTAPYDAQALTEALREADPTIAITVNTDPLSRADLITSIDLFAKSIKTGDVVLIYFSGHGVERDSVNYIIPSSAQAAEPGREGFNYLSVDFILEKLETAGAALSLVVLDACRSDPFNGKDPEELDPPAVLQADQAAATRDSRDLSSGQVVPTTANNEAAGLAATKLPHGTMVAYSAAPGKVSYSLFKGELPSKGSIFTRALVEKLKTINLPFDRVFSVAGAEVSDETKERQTPFLDSSAAGEIMFLKNDLYEEEERETWFRTVKESPEDQQPAAIRQFLVLYPAGDFSTAARRRLGELQNITGSSPKYAFQPQIGGVSLYGALQGGTALNSLGIVANAARAVNVRSAPFAAVMAVLPKGTSVPVVNAQAHPGWATILLPNGEIGFVGSVVAKSQRTNGSEPTIDTHGSNDLNFGTGNEAQQWASAFADNNTTFSISVGKIADASQSHASQLGLLRALRIRSFLIEKGALSKNISYSIDSSDAPADATRVSFNRGQ